jgi:hypothetical protein
MEYKESTCGVCSYWEPVTDVAGCCQKHGGTILDGVKSHETAACTKFDKYVTEIELLE